MQVTAQAGILLQKEHIYATTGKLHLKGNAKRRCQSLQHVPEPRPNEHSKSGLGAPVGMVAGAKSPLGALRSLAATGPHTIKPEPPKPTAFTLVINSFAQVEQVRFYTT